MLYIHGIQTYVILIEDYLYVECISALRHSCKYRNIVVPPASVLSDCWLHLNVYKQESTILLAEFDEDNIRSNIDNVGQRRSMMITSE